MSHPTPRRFRKACVVVLDGAGVGRMPDADRFGDGPCDTIGGAARAVGGLSCPEMRAIGLGRLTRIEGVPAVEGPAGIVMRLSEASNGKDTSTGHWELMGHHIREAFRTFSEGFPAEIIDPFVQATGRKVLGNKPASGTVILDELGPLHQETGALIVYTSADSVFQIAAHEQTMPIEELYDICLKARRILDPWRVARVIARPFVGEPGGYTRTYNRRDFSMPPPDGTLLDRMKRAGYPVVGVGKIGDIFCERGLTSSIHTEGNADGIARTLAALDTLNDGLVFTNLVDFDMLYGHRRDARGFAGALEAFDRSVPHLLDALGPDGVLVVTADHGNDPTYLATTDHTREFVPCLVASRGLRSGADLGTRATFADLGQTLADNFVLDSLPLGESFLRSLG